MSTPSASRARHRLGPVPLVAITAAVLLVLSACGSDGGDEAAADDPIIEVETDNTDDSTVAETDGDDSSSESAADADDGSSDSATAGGDDEEAALAFAACMRDEGIDFPDPTVGADGSIQFFQPGAGNGGGGNGGNGGAGGDGGGFQDSPFAAALEVCQPLIEGASFLPDPAETAERQDRFLELTQCLRDNGLDVADPDFGNGNGPAGGGGGGIFGEDFDPEDPETAAALEACQGIFAGFGPNQGGDN